MIVKSPKAPTTPPAPFVPQAHNFQIGDYVTTELYVGWEKIRVEGKIKEIRPATQNLLPIKVDGFWFNPDELTKPNNPAILPIWT